MAFALKDNSKEQELICIIGGATKEEIAFQEQFDKVHIYADGNSYFINPYDEYDKMRLLERLGVPNYKFFHETTGNKNWVLYNSDHYHTDKDWDNQSILRFNTSRYDGCPIETPINASSLVGLFSWMKLPDNLKFSKRFIVKDIIDLSLLFVGSRIPSNLDISPCLSNTNNLKYTRYMFYKSKIPNNFQLPNDFNTSKVENMEYMFGQTTIPSGFIVNVDTRNATDLNHMFYNTIFLDSKPKYGEHFVISQDKNTNFMFDKLKEKN